jgi:PilX N-terminal
LDTIPNIQKLYYQTGAALIVSMIMLLVVTAIGVAVMGGSHLELLMSNNSYFQTDAYRNAEIALNQGLNNLPSTLNTLSPDPNVISNWNSGTLGTPVTTPTGTGRYAVKYLSLDLYDKLSLSYMGPSTLCAVGPGSSNFCVKVYQVWGYGTDGKGATRLIHETYSVVVGNGAIPKWHTITEIQ